MNSDGDSITIQGRAIALLVGLVVVELLLVKYTQ